MWFKKKKPLLPNILANMPPDARREAELLFGKQLADKALNHRTLKQYDESLKWSELAYKEYQYNPAASIHGNTLVISGRNGEGLQWFMKVFNDLLSKDSPDLLMIEVLANIIWLLRDYSNDFEKAEYYLELARKIEAKLPKTKELNVVSSAIDVEEAILQFNKGNMIKAENLAKRRISYVPNCPRAKSVLSAVRSSNHGALKFYGMIRHSDGAIALDSSLSKLTLRLYRGLDDIQISAEIISMLLLVAKTQGWKADQLFTTNNNGDDLLLPFSNPCSISTEQANSLYRIIVIIPEDEMKEIISFVKQGAFFIEEIV